MPATLVGVVVAGLLLALLGLARLLVPSGDVPDLEIREIEISAVPEPPPPPPEEPPPDAPPPPPALTELSQIPDPTRVPVPKAEIPFDVTLPIDPFFTDTEPAPLPKPVVQQVQRRSSPQVPNKPTLPRRAPAPIAKSYYKISELDGKPSLIRHGRASFPQSLLRRGVRKGTVLLEVELSENGAVRVRRVISASYPELVAPARRVAATARFTPPTRGGRRVKAVMRWPITIKK